MASKRQVRNYLVECLRRHLAPDALRVEASADETKLLLYTRAAGTKDEVGETFVIQVAERWDRGGE